VAWISNKENHHPDLIVSYNKCRVDFVTHSAGGLSENDFICAARIDAAQSA
jgi:4a-hydroxytetrahydrobiopterin dehydratase